MTISAKALFGCNALALDLPYGLVLVEETMAFMSSSMTFPYPSSFKISKKHCKDPKPPWNTCVEFS